MQAEDIRKQIIEAFFNQPVQGKHYIDWQTISTDKCGVTLLFNNNGESFDITIKKL
jgi:hypothetical protein